MNARPPSPARAIVSRRICQSLVVLVLVGHRPFIPQVVGALGLAECRAMGPTPTLVVTPASEKDGRPVDWIRAGLTTNRPVWGIPGGLLWSLPPSAGRSDGPRGLIRLRYPVLTNGAYDLINFIAIEPVVQGRKGFSELERSQLDGVAGKRLWGVHPEAPGQSMTNLPAGQLTCLDPGVETLTLRVGLERFVFGITRKPPNELMACPSDSSQQWGPSALSMPHPARRQIDSSKAP
jgi:hypothetical protein